MAAATCALTAVGYSVLASLVEVTLARIWPIIGIAAARENLLTLEAQPADVPWWEDMVNGIPDLIDSLFRFTGFDNLAGRG